MKKVLSFFSALAIIVAGIIPVNYMISATEEDSTDSKIQIIAEDITVDKDDEVFTLLDEVSATDENGGEVEVTVLDDGDFDVTTIGEYTVTYQAIDPSDESEVTKERLVTVEEPEVVMEEETKTTTEETPVKKSLLRAGPVEVGTVAELQTAINNAVEDTTITLSDTFVFGNVTITMPNVNITVNGNGKVWTTGGIATTGGGLGSVKLTNLTVNGSTISSTLIIAGHTTGELILEDMTLENAQAGAISVKSTGNPTKTTINNTMIRNNTAYNQAPALRIEDNAASMVTINNSTIENNSAGGAGYECGAIGSKNYTGTLEINNTVFKNNVNNCVKSGPFGGGGGAMSMHYLRGSVTINESYFYGNRTQGTATSTENTYDGGAIYVIDGTAGATFTINKTTFDSNIATDDGGAIMFQGTGSPGFTTTITNSTFYNNVAYGLDGGNASGGAIQYYRNGFMGTTFNNTITGCTFVGNIAGNENSTFDQQGGALGMSGSSVAAAATRNSSLFIGNQVYGSSGMINTSSNYKDISNNTTYQSNTNLVNVDKGASPTKTIKDVLGVYNVSLSSNYSSVKAGVDGITVPTVPIMPEGLADNTSGSVVSGVDERSFARYKDIGAVESSWVKYDANGGSFTLTDLTTYDGTKYYEKTDPSDTTYDTYYNVGVADGTSTIESESSLTITAPSSDKEFLGWSTDPDATTPDTTYTPGNSLTYVKENQTLYAIYGEKAPETYNVTYNGNESDGGTVPTDTTNYLFDEDVTVEGQGTMTREGYKFTGWNTDADGNGTLYEPTDTFKIKGDTTLYAQWEELYNVTFDSQEGSAVAPQNNKEAGSKVTEPADPIREGYEFAGWHNEPECTSTWDFNNDTITGHTTLYAKWTEVKVLYTVTFDSQGGSSVSSQTGLASGSKVVEPSDPTREGYEFAGWYTDAKCTTAWDFSNDTITGNMTLYADWNKNKDDKELYTVNFDSQGGSLVDSQTGMNIGDKVTEPAIPTREGYYFDGWYTEAECVTAWNFEDDTISGNMTLYAKWTKEIIVDPTKPTDPKPSIKPEEKPSTQPETGDSTNLTSLLALLGLSSLTVLVAISRKKLFKK